MMSKKPKIIGCVGFKGGVGKTTTAAWLTAAAAAAGVDVIGVDCDYQRSFREWDERADGHLTGTADGVLSASTTAEFERIGSISRGHDVAIVDTPGDYGKTTQIILPQLDLALIPAEPSMISLQELGVTIGPLQRKKIPVLVLIVKADRRRVATQELVTVVASHGYPRCQTVIPEREAIRQSFGSHPDEVWDLHLRTQRDTADLEWFGYKAAWKEIEQR